MNGQKSCLGLYLAETESAKYWVIVMNELKNRGVEDILIFAVDNLTGISDAIETAFPLAEIQKCIVHQIRSSMKYVSWKERKKIAADLKTVYTASSEKEGLKKLDAFAEKYEKPHPYIVKSWRKNWAELSTYFKYSKEIRKLIYTTNPIESFNRGLRKVAKNKSIFPTEDALLKMVYLAITNIEKKWTMKIRNWSAIFSELTVFFEERVEKYID